MPAIEVSHLTKEYRLGALQGLKQTLLNTGARLVGKPAQQRPLFKALDDVSFTIEQGEVVGIIGHNGAGKSTLLKTLARVTTPSSGTVKVNGRIAPLIEVGAGFVPDFTGRENVYLNGAILGMSRKEIDRKFDEIVDFAEMAEFIDTPVKRYSSGMQVKLAFAVATSIESEILIVDEVLAVGDLAFQRKCFDRMEDIIRRQGRTVLLVSHNIRQVARICSRVIMLDHGHVLADGLPVETCDAFYARSNNAIVATAAANNSSKIGVLATGEVSLDKILLIDENDQAVESLTSGRPCSIRCVFEVTKPLQDVEIVFGFHTTDFVYISSMHAHGSDIGRSLEKGRIAIDCVIAELPLEPGVFAVRIGIFDRLLTKIFYGENLKIFNVNPALSMHEKVILPGLVSVAARWKLSSETELTHDAICRSVA
ncbi:MAG TPA: ABC transporter ATP-binding protein [Azoarcus taiwanensis]|nr:ABC transporter ATP-binding protein [Azoarcus taiwanensis]